MGIDVYEFAVEAIAHAHGCLEGLDMDVGGAEAEGLGEQLDDEAYDGCVAAFRACLGVAGGDLHPVRLGGRRAVLRLIKLSKVIPNVLMGGADEVQLTANHMGQ